MYFYIITLNVTFSIVKVDILCFQFLNDFATFLCGNKTRSFDYTNRQIVTVLIFLSIYGSKFLFALNEKTNFLSNDSSHVYEWKKYKWAMRLDTFRLFDSFLCFPLIFLIKSNSHDLFLSSLFDNYYLNLGSYLTYLSGNALSGGTYNELVLEL